MVSRDREREGWIDLWGPRRELFSSLYPEGAIETVGLSAVPRHVRNHFENEARMFMHHANYLPRDFYAIFRINHEDGETTWVAWRRPVVTEDSSQITMWTSLFLSDSTQDGQAIGHGEVYYNLLSKSPFPRGKPYADRVKTEDKFTERGYDIRRLIVMNALCNILFETPLYSSSQFLRLDKGQGPNVRPHQLSWERLVKSGLAKAIPLADGKERYVFEKYPSLEKLRILLGELRARRTRGNEENR